MASKIIYTVVAVVGIVMTIVVLVGIPLGALIHNLAPGAVAKLRERAKIIFVDFHAEATSEKIAFARMLDGGVDPGYLARRGRPSHPSELIHHDCLTYSGDQPHSTWPFTVEGAVVRHAIRSRLESNHGEVLLDAAASGMGIAPKV